MTRLDDDWIYAFIFIVCAFAALVVVLVVLR